LKVFLSAAIGYFPSQAIRFQNILEARSQDAQTRYSIHPIVPPVVDVMVRSRFPRLECPHWGGYPKSTRTERAICRLLFAPLQWEDCDLRFIQSGAYSERNFARQRNDRWEEQYLAALEEAEARSGLASGRSDTIESG
jgi:hypothetical protein